MTAVPKLLEIVGAVSRTPQKHPPNVGFFLLKSIRFQGYRLPETLFDLL